MVGRRLGLAHHDEPAVGGAEHLDGRVVEGGEGRRGDDLSRRARHRAAPGDVDDPVEVGQDRVHVVGHQQDGDALVAADLRDERGHGCLVRQVQAVERLVEDQQPRPAHQRLGDEQPLLLTAGYLADGPAGEGGGADELDHLVAPAGRPGAGSARSDFRRVAGTPHRSPSAPSRTTSMPRTRSPASKLRRWGR